MLLFGHPRYKRGRDRGNNPKKRTGLIGYGLEIIENIPIEVCSNPHNEIYLRTKRDKMGHDLSQFK